MPISKASAINESLRPFKVTAFISSMGEFCGEISHTVLKQPVRFTNSYEFSQIIESTLDSLKYLKPGRDRRLFMPEETADPAGETVSDPDRKEYATGRTFSLTLKSRYNAEWQGMIDFGADGLKSFFSYLDFLEILDRIFCREVSQDVPPRDSNLYLERFFRRNGDNADRRELIGWKKYGSESFSIQARFFGNNSVQGTVIWKEGRREIAFRSFLELAMSMGEAENHPVLTASY